MTLPCPKPPRPKNTPPCPSPPATRKSNDQHAPDAERIANYTPRLVAPDVWAVIGDFVRTAITDFGALGVRPTDALLAPTTRLVAWCHNQGLPLERAVVLDRHTIAQFIERGCEGMAPKSRTSLRSALMRMGRTLALDTHPQRLPKLTAGPVPAPYSLAEQAAFRSWAQGGRTAYRREQSALLLALGFGAGLTRADVIDLRVKHVAVDSEGVLINVFGGKHPRAIPVLRDWEQILVDIVFSRRGPNTHLVLPRAKSRSKNLVNTQRVYGAGAPSTYRMRATWMTALLVNGVPIKAFLSASGVGNLGSAENLLPFLPDPDPVAARRSLRGAEPTSA